MNQVLNLTYASSLTRLCEINSSFDSGVLRIAYVGANRNGSYISKAAFEKSLKTIYNCPIVCHYDRDSDTIGGHDVEVVRRDDGSIGVVNLTTPIGCIPESSNVYWETVTEDDGSEHEYLCAEALLWKRQEAYSKIKKDGISSQSMEITVKDGEMKDGVYKIYDFEFTAFAIIGVEPCFESAALEFAKQDFKQQLSQMMLEIKEYYSKVNPSLEDDINTTKNLTEGGTKVLDEKMALVEKFGIDIESLDFSIEDFSVEELEAKFSEMVAVKNAEETPAEPEPETNPEPENYALESATKQEIERVIELETFQTDWGEMSRYWFVDYDKDAQEAYAWDVSDWLLYGFKYEVDGDSITIDRESKKRKKFAIVDFDEGEQASPIAKVFEVIKSKMADNTEVEAKYQAASEKITSMESELEELRQFKADTEKAAENQKRASVFDKFESLSGVEEFEALKANAENIDAAALEEKCYAILGKNSAAKFTLSNKTPRLKVEKEEPDEGKSQYGGLFEKYGYKAN